MKLLSALVFSLCVLLSGCTTATYGNKFEQISGKENVYSFKVYTGGFAFEKTARKRFDEEVSEFMRQSGYKSYRLLKEEWVPFPLSGVEYLVEFER